MMNSGIMARRPQLEEVLSPKELNALWERLQMMSVTAVQGPLFGGAHLACRIGPGHFRERQELVQAWKQMRKWR